MEALNANDVEMILSSLQQYKSVIVNNPVDLYGSLQGKTERVEGVEAVIEKLRQLKKTLK